MHTFLQDTFLIGPDDSSSDEDDNDFIDNNDEEDIHGLGRSAISLVERGIRRMLEGTIIINNKIETVQIYSTCKWLFQFQSQSTVFYISWFTGADIDGEDRCIREEFSSEVRAYIASHFR